MSRRKNKRSFKKKKRALFFLSNSNINQPCFGSIKSVNTKYAHWSIRSVKPISEKPDLDEIMEQAIKN